AVSDTQGEVRFLVRSATSECQIFNPEVQLWDGASEAEVIRVNTLPLDSLLEQRRPAPGLIKIDIEGAEALALAGAARLLRDFHPVVIVEVHNEKASV